MDQIKDAATICWSSAASTCSPARSNACLLSTPGVRPSYEIVVARESFMDRVGCWSKWQMPVCWNAIQGWRRCQAHPHGCAERILIDVKGDIGQPRRSNDLRKGKTRTPLCADERSKTRMKELMLGNRRLPCRARCEHRRRIHYRGRPVRRLRKPSQNLTMYTPVGGQWERWGGRGGNGRLRGGAVRCAV